MDIQIVSSLGKLKKIKICYYAPVQAFVWIFAFISLGKMFRSEISVFMVSTCLRNSQNVSKSGYIILPFYKQCVRGPVVSLHQVTS